MARQHPWNLCRVPWSPDQEFTRGVLDGLPLMSWGIADRSKLATKRQLRARGLRPGGQSPVAVLYFRCARAGRKVHANLYLIDQALPVRPMTPARRAALDKAMAARRTCRECRETGYAELPKAHRTCEACLYSQGRLDPFSYVHDYLIGTPVFAPAEEAAVTLPHRLAPVIPIRSAPSYLDSAQLTKVVA